MQQAPTTGTPAVLSIGGLQALIEALAHDGYTVLGPTVRDGVIVYAGIENVKDMPAGWASRQEAGSYRLERREDGALSGFNVPAQSWKQFLLPPAETLWTAHKSEDGFAITPGGGTPAKYAFLGVHACDLHAIAIQDRVLSGGAYRDTAYAARRNNAFIVAFNCSSAGGTCFCASMGTGPRASAGYDLALTELLQDGNHSFLAEAGSERGAALLAQVPNRPAEGADLAAAEAVLAKTASQMGRSLDTNGLKAALQANPRHPRWQETGERCLSCGNCTMVCPTCFCVTVEDRTSLDGQTAERVKKWDSCFTLDYSYLHGGSVRRTAARATGNG